MRVRTHKLGTTLLYAVAIAVVGLVAFSSLNAGVDTRPGYRFDGFDPHFAAMAVFGFFGLVCSVAIIVFDDDDSDISRAAATDPRIPRPPDSYTGFVRQPWHKVLAVGAIFGAVSAVSVFIWLAIAKFPGTPGTVWGDYASSALPALTLFLALWSVTNGGFTLAALAEAFNRDRRVLCTTALVAMFVIGLGLGFLFMTLPNLPTAGALILTAVAFPLSILTVTLVRAWAMVRVDRWDALTPAARQRQSLYGSDRPGSGHPPYDMLARGEKLLLHFGGDGTAEPQLLIATNRRFARASIVRGERTFVLEQTEPGQLSGASTQFLGGQLVTTAHFRNRADMRVDGGDPAASRAFAEAVTALARTGKIGP